MIMSNTEREVLLEVNNLKQYFKINSKTTVKAVDDISFKIYKGETFGLVGESGSGKSTTGRSIIRLYKPTGGDVIFKGNNIAGKITKAQKAEICQKIQMIFQDPMACLNPRMRVIDIIAEGLDIHKLYKTKAERQEKVYTILEAVGLSPDHAGRYPHEFSGGQRQRIGIARALITNPEFIIADEPISALDVSIQAQVVNLMNVLKKEFGLTYLFIAHDLSMVKYISDRIGVMHLGRLVELGSADDIYHSAIHPYTRSLLSAIPLPDPNYERNRKRVHYDKSQVDYYAGDWVEVNPGHFVLGTPEDLTKWKSELKK